MRIKFHQILISLFFTLLIVGCKDDEILRSYPRVQTRSVVDVSSQGATLNGEIISSNADSISAVGFVWSESNNPTVSNSEVVYLDPSVIDDGNFHFILRTTLDDDKRYWVRAFATQGELRVFGDTTSFTSLGSFSNPVITDFEPKSGKDSTVINILGEGFSHKNEENNVFFGSIKAKVVSSSIDQLNVLVPTGISTRESVLKVVVTGNEYEAEEKFIRNAPIVDSFTPLTSACGTSVTITGSNFSTIANGNKVYFGDSPAVITSFLSDELIVTTPSELSAEPLKISVETAGQTSVSTENFISDSPTIGSYTPTSGTDNDLITITGSNFGSAAEGVVVTIGSLIANIVSVNSTEIVVEVPAGIESSEVELSVQVGCAAEYVSPVLFNRLAPVIADFNPKSAECGETITISGSNFGTTISTNKVFFDDMQVAIQSASSSELQVSPFQIASGTYDLSVEVAGQQVTAANQINLTDSELCDESLIAYYPFNGNANDESGNGNHGVVVGASLTTDRNGNPNSAYNLDGIYDYINLDALVDNVAMNSEGSFSFWIKPDNVMPSSSQYLLSFGDTNGYRWLSCRISSTSDGFGTLMFASRNNTPVLFAIGTENQLSSSNWSHVVCVQDGVQPKIYVNGVLVPQEPFDTQSNPTGWFEDIPGIDNGRIGYLDQNNKKQGYFEGSIDDLLIYSRGLTQSEVLVLYND